VSRAGSLLAGTCLVTALTAAALAGSAGPAAAAVAYSCSGNAAVDQAHLEPLLAAGGSITLRGPRSCVGNYLASGVTVAITGAGGGVTMDGGGTGSILVVDNATVTISNLTLTNGQGSGPDVPGQVGGANGGGVSMIDSRLTVSHCRIVGNHADDQGGGIHAAKSTVTVIDSTVSNNTSHEGGGGIDADDEVGLTVSGSTVTGNSTGPHGGGLELFDGTLTVTDSRISGNAVTASSGFRSGGGIWAGMADVSLTGSIVSNNRSTEFGGGIGYSGGAGKTLLVTSSTISGNQATDGGGGIRNDAYYGDAVLLVDHSTLAQNTAGQGGGIDAFGLHGFTSSVSITSSTIAGNRAPQGLGGAIDSYIDPSRSKTSISVASTTIGPRPQRVNDSNQALFGGGIAANGQNGYATIHLASHAVVTRNRAHFDGGGVFTRNGATLTTGWGVLIHHNHPDNTS
jgi:fibronectin-binding autotransporter adhesin